MSVTCWYLLLLGELCVCILSRYSDYEVQWLALSFSAHVLVIATQRKHRNLVLKKLQEILMNVKLCGEDIECRLHFIWSIKSEYDQSWGRSVSIVTRLQAGWLGFSSHQGQWRDFFSLPLCPDQLWGHPASYPVGAVDALPGSEVAREWSWPFTSI